VKVGVGVKVAVAVAVAVAVGVGVGGFTIATTRSGAPAMAGHICITPKPRPIKTTAPTLNCKTGNGLGSK